MQQSFTERILIGLLLVSAAPAVVLAAPAINDSGAQAKEIAGQTPAAATVENPGMPAAPAAPESMAHFTAEKIVVQSEVPFAAAELEKITAPYTNRSITLKDLQEAADRVTAYCRVHGYPAAAAYVPAQTAANGGTLTIAVAPGRYGVIGIDDKSRLGDGAIRSLAASLKPGQIITTRVLETVLYNINDLGGVHAAGVLSPGEAIGTSDLTIRVENGKGRSFILYAENYGNTSSGRYRYGLQGDWYNLGAAGGHLSAGGLISNHDLHNYSLAWEQLAGHGGTKVGIGFSRMDYNLGGILQAYKARGTADTISLFGTTPLWTTAQSRMRIVYGYDYRALRDELSAYAYNVEKHSNVFHAGLVGQQRSGRNVTQYSGTVYAGRLGLDTVSANAAFSSRPSGSFAKGTFNVSSLQGFDSRWDMLMRLQGQMASCSLDSSEQIFLGGASGVRAYPQGDGAGDNGWLGSAELRYHTKYPGLVLSTYFDTGHVALRSGQAGSTMSGWGLGISYMKPDDWFARFDYARRIGLVGNASQEDKANDRMWFILGKLW